MSVEVVLFFGKKTQIFKSLVHVQCGVSKGTWPTEVFK